MTNKAKRVMDRYMSKVGFGVTGGFLPSIAEYIAEVYGSKQYIRINVPYSTFTCRGAAGDIARDTRGVMPFSKSPISVDKTTTLFYGNRKVHAGNFLPFLSDCSNYFIDSIDESNKNEIVFNLVNAPSWRTYL